MSGFFGPTTQFRFEQRQLAALAVSQRPHPLRVWTCQTWHQRRKEKSRIARETPAVRGMSLEPHTLPPHFEASLTTYMTEKKEWSKLVSGQCQRLLSGSLPITLEIRSSFLDKYTSQGQDNSRYQRREVGRKTSTEETERETFTDKKKSRDLRQEGKPPNTTIARQVCVGHASYFHSTSQEERRSAGDSGFCPRVQQREVILHGRQKCSMPRSRRRSSWRCRHRENKDYPR